MPDVPTFAPGIPRAHNLPVGRNGLETDGSPGVARSARATNTGVYVRAYNAVGSSAFFVVPVGVDVDGGNSGDEADEDVGSVHPEVLDGELGQAVHSVKQQREVRMNIVELAADGKIWEKMERDLQENPGGIYRASSWLEVACTRRLPVSLGAPLRFYPSPGHG